MKGLQLNRKVILVAGFAPLLAVALCTSAFAQATQPPIPPTQVASATPVPAANAFTQSAASSQVLHCVVGRSIFLGTAERVKRVYIANPLVLDSYTANPHEVVLTSKAPGTSSVILWDETGRTQSYQISSDIDVEDLTVSMKRAMPAEDVQVHSRENHIVLNGTVSTDAKAEAAGKLAALYSKEVTNSLAVNRALIKQVNLKVRIVEVDRSKMNQFAFNFFTPTSGTLLTNTTTQQFPTNTVAASSGTSGALLALEDPLNFLVYSAKRQVGAALKDLENKQVLQILAEPNITTLSGEKATFLAGGEFPFPVIQGSSGGLTSITIQFRSYGVKVDFTPTVNPDGTVELKVAPEVSALDYTNAVTISGYTIPALSTRKADTQVTLRSGQSFAISGLLDKRTTDLYANTPGFSNVPIIGQLFRSKGVTHTDTELIVIVSPEVIDPLNRPEPFAEPKTVIPVLVPDRFDKSLPADAHAIVSPVPDKK